MVIKAEPSKVINVIVFRVLIQVGYLPLLWAKI